MILEFRGWRLALMVSLALVLLSSSSARAGRTLERLSRGDVASMQELERLVTAKGFALLDSRPACAQRGNELGLTTGEYNSHGWIQYDYPKSFLAAPKQYSYSDLAISTAACDKLYDERGEKHGFPGWLEARDRCQVRGYQPLRVYVEMHPAHDPASRVSDFMTDDPWNVHHEVNVRYLEVSDLLELRRKIAALVMDCHVIEYLFVGSHGSPNTIYFSRTNTSATIAETIRTGISLCSLAPAAKLQFAGCSVACGWGARAVAKDLQNLVGTDPVPAGKVSLLLNTATGHEWQFPYTKSLRSENGIAIEYSLQSNTAASDFDVENAPACEDL